jgi:REP element-mobilizing transposase RayT
LGLFKKTRSRVSKKLTTIRLPASKNRIFSGLRIVRRRTPLERNGFVIGEVGEVLGEILQRVAEAYVMAIKKMEGMEDHIHVFLSAPLRYSPSRLMQIMKSISVRELFA